MMKKIYLTLCLCLISAQFAFANEMMSINELKKEEALLLKKIGLQPKKNTADDYEKLWNEAPHKLKNKNAKRGSASIAKESDNSKTPNNQKANNNISDSKLKRTISRANKILRTSKSTTSKFATNKDFYTISFDYFDENDNDAYYVYTSEDVTLHTLPSLSSKMIYLVRANTKLKVDKNHGAWYRVKSADNKYGWIIGEMIYFRKPTDNEFSALKIRGKSF